MSAQNYDVLARDEHSFWLQVLGDHARFILESLGVKEKYEIQHAERYIVEFDMLLSIVRREMSSGELAGFNKQVIDKVRKLKVFKLHLIQRHLTEHPSLNLSPSLLSHMINELEEYESILRYLDGGKIPPLAHPIHHHLLWVVDAIGHSASISSSLDMSERELRKELKEFEQDFCRYYNKVQELAGYLRTGLLAFPALTRLNQEINQLMIQFISLLNELKDLSLKNEILGSTNPLFFDHMLREECYYLKKLSQVTDILPPNCNPASPRIELP